jgi:hypothetical protein
MGGGGGGGGGAGLSPSSVIEPVSTGLSYQGCDSLSLGFESFKRIHHLAEVVQL